MCVSHGVGHDLLDAPKQRVRLRFVFDRDLAIGFDVNGKPSGGILGRLRDVADRANQLDPPALAQLPDDVTDVGEEEPRKTVRLGHVFGRGTGRESRRDVELQAERG